MRTVLIILASVIIALIAGSFIFGKSGGEVSPAKETAYERVIRTGVLRCGYAVFAPYFTKDVNTGAFGGIWYDLTEAIAKRLDLKVNWVEEVGFGDVSAALDAKRIDAFCSMLWTAGKRARAVNFLNPAAYEPILVYVKADDHRFDKDISAINNQNIRVSTIDGEGGALIAREDFPKAKMVSLPQLANYGDMFNQVVTGKADITLSAPSGAAVFLKSNPGALRPLLDHPMRILSATIAVKYGEQDLKDMLNTAQDDVINSGEMAKIIAKGEVNKGDFWQVGVPYRMQKQ